MTRVPSCHMPSGTSTVDLHALADWCIDCGIQTVAYLPSYRSKAFSTRISQELLIVFAMTLPEYLNSLDRDELLALIAALQRRVTELTAANEVLRTEAIAHV